MSNNKERKEFCRKYRKLQYKCSLESWKLSNLKKIIDNTMESELKELKELVLNGEGYKAYSLIFDYDYLSDFDDDEFDMDDIFYDEIYNECITMESLNKIEPYVIKQIRINNNQRTKAKRQYVYHDKKFKEYKAELDNLDYNIGGRFISEGNKIVINRIILNGNLLDTRNYNDNKEFNEQIIQLFIHELCHYIARKWFSNVSSIYPNQSCDNSPIFIAINYWFNPNEENGYESFKIFKNSETYNDIMSKKTLFDLYDCLYDYFYTLKNNIDYVNSELVKENEIICYNYCNPINCTTDYNLKKIGSKD